MTEKEVLERIERAGREGATRLALSDCKLTSVPAELVQLTNLQWLYLGNNQLTSVPAELVQLTNLQRLYLGNNQLTSVPAELVQLTNLQRLHLHNNQLMSVPAEMGQLTNLQVLTLGNNQLTSVPAELGQLTNLQRLYLGNNQLTSVPAELVQLTNLQRLYLHNNQLMSVPAELGQLTNLQVLTLHNNQLTSVPAELGQLTNLEWLYLGNNQLTSVPAELVQLTNLQRLDLGNNQLTSVPAELGQLTNLQRLHLHNNQLTSVPAELGQLTNLQRLDLGSNQLTSVPGELGQLTNLQALKLYDNPLTSLPAELGQLKRLRQFSLHDNPDLKSPPPEVVGQGMQAMLAYLRELAKGEKKRYEAKLLVLGDGSEGKTCVQRALRGEDFEEQIRTPGVEVHEWDIEHPGFPGDGEKKIRLNIWDFEGQEINHQSHQFFLTQGSLYLLVINGRRTFSMDKAEYWLDTIRARAPESRVMLVASECEETTPSWPLDKLKQEYGDLLQGEKWYFPVGCASGVGIDELKKEIQTAAADLEQMGREWPESYQRAEEAIRKRGDADARVGRSELREIFKASGIDEENRESAARDMARLGAITVFEDCPALEDFVVLNPQWLTKGISLVMEDKKLKDDKGEITHERMKEIWDEGYEGLYETLHSCMREFELLYDMEDKRGCLVPLRFGDVRPAIPWSGIAGAKERQVEYRLNIHPPKGIMSRFIVKTHHMIAKTEAMPKGVYWDKGVFLRTGEGEFRSEALCEFIEDDRIIRFTVRAAFPQNMIEQLHGFAKAVFSFFEGLKPERSYGCRKFEGEAEEECKGAHPEKRILFALLRDKTIDCETGWHEVDPKRLVYGFSSFGEGAATMSEIRAALEKQPKWAEGLAGDIESSLVWIDKIYGMAVEIRRGQKRLPAELGQEVELKLRDHIRLMNEMLDNRDFNSAPAVVAIAPCDGSKFNRKNWFEKEYELRPYCEVEGGVHPIDFRVKFTKPKDWWIKTAPKLSLAVKVLSRGVRIACAGLPLTVGTEVFDTVEDQVSFMKELAGHLELKGGAESDLSDETSEYVRMTDRSGNIHDLRQFKGEDTKRMLRMQLAELLKEIAPEEYAAREWGPLRRVRMADNTYRWLCGEHA